MWSGRSPDLENERRGLGRAQLPALIVLLFLSWSFRPQGMNPHSLYPGRGPIYLLPHLDQLTRPWPWPQGPSSPSKARSWPLPISHSSKIHSQNLSHALPKLQPCPGAPQPLAPGAWPGLGPASGVPEKTLFLSPCFLDPPLHTCYLLVLHTGALPTAHSPLSPLPSLHSRHEHLLVDGPPPLQVFQWAFLPAEVFPDYLPFLVQLSCSSNGLLIHCTVCLFYL